jgi:hypothetical protein
VVSSTDTDNQARVVVGSAISSRDEVVSLKDKLLVFPVTVALRDIEIEL